jgi:hypothetical protein
MPLFEREAGGDHMESRKAGLKTIDEHIAAYKKHMGFYPTSSGERD